MRDVDSIIEMIIEYFGSTQFLILFGICLVVLFFLKKGARKKEIVVIAVLALLLIFNDIVWKTMDRYLESSTYYRFLWIVPVLLVMAYVVVEGIGKLPQKWAQIGVVVLLLGVLILSGKSYVGFDKLQIPSNGYKISQDTVTVCNLVSADKQKDRPVVAWNMWLEMESRVYDPSVLWAISKDDFEKRGLGDDKMADILIDFVEAGQMDEAKVMQKALDEKKVDYIVVNTAFGTDEYLKGLNCREVGQTEIYTVYAVGL